VARDRPGNPRGPVRLSALIALIGLLATAVVAFATWQADQNNERRLLRGQTRQAANAISGAILNIQAPLATGVEVGYATQGNQDRYTRYIAAYVGPGKTFINASLWRLDGPTPTLIAATGDAPELSLTSPTGHDFLKHAAQSKTFVVTPINVGPLQRVAYALSNAEDHTYAVYAERVIPANRRVPVESDSAFADIHFATYFGPSTDMADLQTTDLPNSSLPLTGRTARQDVAFGDKTITLVTSPAKHLGGSLEQNLPWMIVGGGVLLTAAAAGLGGQLARRRLSAEQDASTISRLYRELDLLYGKQRTIAETLQHALLPQNNPHIADLTIATRYVAGAQGVDIGGDWYSIIALDEHHFGFVVGDVSGRGIDAASLMARIRFTLRAYLVEGHPPATALEMCSRQVDILDDGHLATVIVGIADTRTRELRLANAGHPSPLLVRNGVASFIPTEAGPPLGIRDGSYTSTTSTMPAGSTLLAFTDGLVERRGEDIDEGLGRLAAYAATAGTAATSLDDLVSAVVEGMVSPDDGEDDIAILAFRWAEDRSS